MKLSRRGKSARRGRHTKRAGKHLRYRGKKVRASKRYHRAHKRTYKRGRRVHRGGVLPQGVEHKPGLYEYTMQRLLKYKKGIKSEQTTLFSIIIKAPPPPNAKIPYNENLDYQITLKRINRVTFFSKDPSYSVKVIVRTDKLTQEGVTRLMVESIKYQYDTQEPDDRLKTNIKHVNLTDLDLELVDICDSHTGSNYTFIGNKAVFNDILQSIIHDATSREVI